MTSKTLLMQNTIIVLVAIFLGITTVLALATIEAGNKKFTNSSITTTKGLDHKTSTNCNRTDIRLVPKPNGGFTPYIVLIPDPNCKENQDE